MRNLRNAKLDGYNTLIMVSGRYALSDAEQQKIKDWVANGNTLITISGGSSYAIGQKWVNEKLVEAPKDSVKTVSRLPYVDAPENSGKESVGGIILEANLDLTHPLSFGYQRSDIPVYKNNEVWLAPSKSPYGTVAQYTENPHIDGFITAKNLNDYAKKSASLVVSRLGGGRVILFADNPNFRGSWYGTNRLLLNALFLGNHIQVPN
jgi:hypothetical protein